MKDHLRPGFAEISDDELDGVNGGQMGPTPLQPPSQPQPSRPSIPRDPGLPGATPQPTSPLKSNVLPTESTNR